MEERGCMFGCWVVESDRPSHPFINPITTTPHLVDGDHHGVPRPRQLLKALERRLALEGVQA